MNSYLIEVLKTANLDVAVATKEGKFSEVSKLASIQALKKALGADVAFNIVCNGSCDDPIESIKDKFTHVQNGLQVERLKPILGNDKAFNIVCNGSCADTELDQITTVNKGDWQGPK